MVSLVQAKIDEYLASLDLVNSWDCFKSVNICNNITIGPMHTFKEQTCS